MQLPDVAQAALRSAAWLGTAPLRAAVCSHKVPPPPAAAPQARPCREAPCLCRLCLQTMR